MQISLSRGIQNQSHGNRHLFVVKVQRVSVTLTSQSVIKMKIRQSILRVMYGMYKGSHFMGKGFGVWLSVRTLRKPAVRKFFFLPFVPLSVSHCSSNPVARPEEWMGKDKYLDSLEWIRRNIVSKGGVCLCTVYKINWFLHVF